MAEKSEKKGGAGKFILGAVLGGIAGAIAGKFIKLNQDDEDDEECNADEGRSCYEKCKSEKKDEEGVKVEKSEDNKDVKKTAAKKTSEKK